MVLANRSTVTRNKSETVFHRVLSQNAELPTKICFFFWLSKIW